MTYPTGAADFTDVFDEPTADADPISTHSPDTGLSWSDPANNDDNLIVNATDDAVYHPSGVFTQFSGAIANVTGGWEDDHVAEATGASTTHVQQYACVAVRMADAASGPRGYVAYHNGGTNRWVIARIDSGSTTPTILHIGLFDNSPVAGDRIALEAVGNTLNLYLNAAASDSPDVTYDTTSDGTRYDTGSPGILGRPSAETYIDNFKAWGEAAISGPTITDVANSGETPGSGSESWEDGSTGNVITGSGFV